MSQSADRQSTSAHDLSLDQQVRLLSGSGFWNTQALPKVGVPSIRLSDGPHGLRAQPPEGGDHLGLTSSLPATCFPPAVTLASAWDVELAEEVGRAIGDEALARDVAVVLGPGINLKRHPRGGRNFEYFSEDPLLSGRLGAAWVTGVQSRGVGTSLKHFAVNNQEYFRYVVDAIVDDRTLRELYLSAFEHVVKTARPWTVMAAYNKVNGQLMTENRDLLTGILRDEWGFDGAVVSDWGATGERVATLQAGMDLEMPSSRGISDGRVKQAVADGRLEPAVVAQAAQRLLDLVAKSGSAAAAPAFESLVEGHDALARQVAAAGTVLLRNDGTLPLTGSPRVAVIGDFARHPRYQGAGSSLVTPTRVTILADALQARGIEATYAGDDPTQAAQAAAAADVAVVMVGLPAIEESEGFDRETLELPAAHNALVEAVCAANPRTVVVLSCGAPVLLPWREQPAAILATYLGGQASGAALAEILYGDAEPGGRLAETWVASDDQVAADPFFPGPNAKVGGPRQTQHREGLFVGYRHTSTAGLSPAYPFGFGLSYTSFDWGASQLSVDRIALPKKGEAAPIQVSVQVTNTGQRAGSEVVQVYVSDRTGVVLRPARELAGFAKVHLQPAESRQVTITIEPRALQFWEPRTGEWRTPSGEFELQLARSADDLVATHRLIVERGVDLPAGAEAADVEPVAASDAAFAKRLRRPIPAPLPTRPFTLDSTMAEVEQTRAGRLLRLGIERAKGRVGGDSELEQQGALDPVQAKMIKRSLDEMPLRALALYSNGMLTWQSMDVLIDVLNGNRRELARGVLRQALRVSRPLRARLPFGR